MNRLRLLLSILICFGFSYGGIDLSYKNGYQDLPTDAFIHGMVKLKNSTSAPIGLSDLVVEYYFDAEGATASQFAKTVYWFESGQTSDVTLEVTPFAPETTVDGKKTSMTVKIGVKKVMNLAVGASTTIQFGLNRTDWKTQKELTHYSYKNQPFNNGFASNSNIVVRQKSTGVVLAGTEPRTQVNPNPAVVISSPATGTVVNTTPYAISWSVDGVVQTTNLLAELVEGTNQVIRSFTNGAGATGADTVSLILDTQAPVVSILSPVAGTVTNSATATVQWSVDGTVQTLQTAEPLVEGVNTITRTATDAAGNVGTASVEVTLDTKAPVVAISYPLDGAVFDVTPIALQWTIDGEPQFGDIFVNLVEGTNTITRTATDAAGNVGTTSLLVVFQVKTPVVEIVSPVAGTVVTTPTIAVEWRVDGVVQSVETIENLAVGTNTITRSFSRNGKTGTASVSVTYEPIVAVPVVAIVSPAEGAVVTTSSVAVVWSVDGIDQPTETVESLAVGANTITRSFTRSGKTGTASVTVTYRPVVVDPNVPVDPVTVAPKLDSTQITSLKDATAFLYTGPAAIQKNLTATIDEKRVCVVRGTVYDKNNQPLPGIKVTISNQGSYGYTYTRADGMFDLVVNGGGSATVRYEHSNYLASERLITLPVKDFTFAPDVVLIPQDSKVTTIVTGSTEVQVAQGSVVSDVDGTRQATILFPAGVEVVGGNGQPINVRATEYTVGENGPKAMPATLPATTAYTYCVELAVDGMDQVNFTKPLPVYVDNFLGFPVGGIVPSGYYDSQKDAWIPSDNGKIVKLLSVVDGKAVLDVTGSGQPATDAQLTTLGITADELTKIAGVHTVGKSYWRVPVTHFTPWDYNWPYGPEDGAEAPANESPVNEYDPLPENQSCPIPSHKKGE